MKNPYFLCLILFQLTLASDFVTLMCVSGRPPIAHIFDPGLVGVVRADLGQDVLVDQEPESDTIVTDLLLHYAGKSLLQFLGE